MDESSDVDILARTLWGEARNQSEDGIRAVAFVVVNRAAIARAYMAKRPASRRHPLYGDGTARSAARMPSQFSCWNQGDSNRPKLEAVTEGDPEFKSCLRIARAALDGRDIDPTDGATHYYERHIPPPPWAAGKTPIAIIGVHLFFKNV